MRYPWWWLLLMIGGFGDVGDVLLWEKILREWKWKTTLLHVYEVTTGSVHSMRTHAHTHRQRYTHTHIHTLSQSRTHTTKDPKYILFFNADTLFRNSLIHMYPDLTRVHKVKPRHTPENPDNQIFKSLCTQTKIKAKKGSRPKKGPHTHFYIPQSKSER